MNGEAKRTRLDQRRAPIHEALENFRRMRVVPFDVPGHKRGRGNPELTAFLGQQCVGVDVNSMKPLDNLCHPVSVIREAEELAAFDYFDIDAILSYLVRVNLVARWSRLDPAHGREMFARLVEALDGRKLIENKQ